jgi:hypothetical protein
MTGTKTTVDEARVPTVAFSWISRAADAEDSTLCSSSVSRAVAAHTDMSQMRAKPVIFSSTKSGVNPTYSNELCRKSYPVHHRRGIVLDT